MSGSSPLGDVYLSHLSQSSTVEPAAVGALLDAELEEARRRWPSLNVDPVAFVTDLALRAPQDSDPLTYLRSLSTDELYITYACALGNPDAISTFDETYFSYVEQVLGGARASPDQIKEIKQILRERFFVSHQNQPRGIAAFSGRGSLRGWVRISALREFYRLTDKGKKTRGLEDDELQRIATEHDDPELDNLKHRCRDEFQTAFRAALGSLSARQRNLLRHHYIDGMNIDDIGHVYRVHRATAARWIAKARAAVFSKTRQALMAQMEITQTEFHSVMRLLQSQMDMSIRTYFESSEGE